MRSPVATALTTNRFDWDCRHSNSLETRDPNGNRVFLHGLEMSSHEEEEIT